MKKRINNSGPFTLAMRISSTKPVVLHVLIVDPVFNTVYFDRQIGTKEEKFKGEEDFDFPLVSVPANMDVRLKDKETGSTKDIKIKKIWSKPLVRDIKEADLRPEIKDFMSLAKKISSQASHMYNGLYKKGKWSIKLTDSIKDENGKEIDTVARVDHITGQIEIKRKDFLKLSWVGRMHVLGHEFTHFQFNEFDEVEADTFSTQLLSSMGASLTELATSLPRLFGDCKSEEKCNFFADRSESVMEILYGVQNQLSQNISQS